MAVFSSYLLGDVKKSVANLTMYSANGKSIVRSKPLSVRNPKTKKQKVQREKMSILCVLASALGAVLKLGFPKLKVDWSANNYFVKNNQEIVTVDETFRGTVDYEKLTCSAGSLKAPKVSVDYDQDAKQFIFTQTVQQQSLTCNPTDIAWVAVYEKVLREAEIYELKARSEGGIVTAELREDWLPENCEFYVFARNAEGTMASRTSWIKLIVS